MCEDLLYVFDSDLAVENGAVTLQGDDGLTYVFNSAGNLVSATSASSKTSAAIYTYADPIGGSAWPELTSITDPVSGRSITLRYGGDAACPTSPPSPLTVAPSGMLCSVTYWDGSSTDFWYTATTPAQLGRIADPGGSTTDFAYDANGNMVSVRSPLAYDELSAGMRTDSTCANTCTTIAYTGNQVSSVTLPAPSSPTDARPAHSYVYVSSTETQVNVAGLTEPKGYDRQVTFDTQGRTLTDTDADGNTTTYTWDNHDDELTKTDPEGLETSTVYDWGYRPTDVYGPAPSSYFASTGLPLSQYASAVAHATTAYDGGIAGLAATYYGNDNLAGAPVAWSTGVGTSDGSVNQNWAGNAPEPGLSAGDNWSLRLTGEIFVPSAGSYSLSLVPPTGGSWNSSEFGNYAIYIDDVNVANTLGEATSAFTNTSAGSYHRIRIDYSAGPANEIQLDWSPPTGGGYVMVPGADLFAAYGLTTSHTDADGDTTTTQYGSNPELGLATASVVDPTGLDLASTTTYDSAANFYRKLSSALPKGSVTATTDSYYGSTQTVSDPRSIAQTVTASQAFSYAGSPQSFTVPAGVTSLSIEATGGAGGPGCVRNSV